MKKLIAYLRGMWEYRSSLTWADPASDDYSDLDDAYDRGRDMAHRLTGCRFED